MPPKGECITERNGDHTWCSFSWTSTLILLLLTVLQHRSLKEEKIKVTFMMKTIKVSQSHEMWSTGQRCSRISVRREKGLLCTHTLKSSTDSLQSSYFEILRFSNIIMSIIIYSFFPLFRTLQARLWSRGPARALGLYLCIFSALKDENKSLKLW